MIPSEIKEGKIEVIAECDSVLKVDVERLMDITSYGAPIPKGCNCVLCQEDTDYGEDTVAIYKELKPYANYCFTVEVVLV